MIDPTRGGTNTNTLTPTEDNQQNSGTEGTTNTNEQSQGEQNNQANNAQQAQAAPVQTSVWDKFLSELPDVDPNYENPLLFVPGSRGTSETSAKYAAYVRTVLVDPATTVPDSELPANYDNPTPAQFLSWHQSVQLRYLSEKVDQADLAAGRVVIGTGTDKIGVVRSDDKREVIIVNQLTRSTIASFSPTEQQRIATNPIFKETLAVTLGLLPNATLDVAGSRTLLKSDIQAKIDEITNKHPSKKSRQPFDTDKQVYIDQLKLIQAAIDDSAVFSRSDVAGQVNKIMERFERAFNYYDVTVGARYADLGSGRGFVSADSNASINKGYTVFIEQERRIYAIEQSSRQMLQQQGINSTDENGNVIIAYLDVPTLVAFIQNNQGLKTQSIITMRTEQLTQLNTLSQAYSEMQRIINETLKEFTRTGTDANDEKHNLKIDWTKASPFTQNVIYMFEDTSTGTGHPVEKDFSVTRPTHNMMNNPSNYFIEYSRTQWERFSTQLSDAVTLLNPQLLTNDINQDNRERTRSTEQASNTVRRQYELTSGIARAFT